MTVYAYPGPTPWRRSSRPVVNVNISLSRASWHDLWRVASDEDMSDAERSSRANPWVKPEDMTKMTRWYVSKPSLRALLLQDLAQEGSLAPNVRWYELEQRRRVETGGGASGICMTRDQYEQHQRRRGALRSSEYAAHLIFSALEEKLGAGWLEGGECGRLE